MKNILILGGIALVLLAGGAWLSQSPVVDGTTYVSSNGLHTHPTLEIFVRGERVPISGDIGVGAAYAGRPGYGMGGMAMTPIHTHDDIPVIHLEFSGRVTDEDIKLGRFFEVSGKDMRSFGQNMHMTVNGAENIEYENYKMQDKDVIELHYD